LHLEQIDFLRLSLTVDRQLVRGQVQFMPKTSSSRRTIPLIEETVLALSAHLAAFPAGPGGLVFHRPDGTPLSHRSVDSTWAAAAARAGIPGLRLHDMRHYYATSLLRQGLDIVEVSHLLGHARPSITADIYAHIQSDHEDRARDALRRVFGTRHQVVTGPSVQAKSVL
jgi:integrase